MKNREYMKHTFDQIHASSELEERIMGMKKEKRNGNAKKWVAVAASLALVFLACNVITYAQTGKTWMKLISGEHYTKGDWNMGKLIPLTRPDGNTYYVQVGKAAIGLLFICGGDPQYFQIRRNLMHLTAILKSDHKKAGRRNLLPSF